MVTKSINKSRPFLWLSLLIGLSVVALLLAKDISQHRAYFNKNYYFTTNPFYNQLSIHFNLIKYVHIESNNFPGWSVQKKLSLPRVEELRRYYENLQNDKANQVRQAYGSKITAAERAGNAEETARLQKEQFEQTSAALSQLERSKQKEIDQYLIYRSNQYDEVKRSLESRSGILYYSVKDLKTGDVFTNMNGSTNQETEQKNALYSFSLPQSNSDNKQFQSMNSYFQQNRLEGTFIIPKQVQTHSQFVADYNYYLAIRDRMMKEIALLCLVILLGFSLYAHIRKSAITWSDLATSITALLQRFPLDLRIVVAGLALIVLFEFDSAGRLFSFPIHLSSFFRLALYCLLGAFVLLQCADCYRLYRQPEQLKREWRQGITIRLLALFQNSMVNKKIVVKAALVFLATVILGMMIKAAIAGIIDGAGGLVLFAGMYFLFYVCIVVPYVLRRISALGSIMTGAQAIAAGNFSYTVEETGRGHLFQLARHMNNTKLGLMKSLESQIRSERLKSELITNVSHDLKTPLTSIINYVGLLKDKELPREKTDHYLEVLDRKTARLKLLIEDLFEASKIASGSVELELDNVNVSALLNQALAECGEQIAASSCTLKVDIANPKLYARLDGKKTWRVFENLIGNAVKYALPHTRIHVSLMEKEGQVLFTISNVSAYEIEFDAEELFERFKRGDKSRHTEGSGLGLAIAKSIVELQGGQLRIGIDGDYFKATVTFEQG